MRRTVLFVLLLLTTGAVLADDKAEAGQAAGAGQAQAKTDAPQGQKEEAPAKTDAAQGQKDEGQAETGEDAKLISVPGGKALGMSILGNEEAPKALVIVPWKTSELGNSLGIEPMLDDSRQPIDKDVFMRALRYYEIRSGTTGHNDTTGGKDHAAAGSDAAQSTATRRR